MQGLGFHLSIFHLLLLVVGGCVVEEDEEEDGWISFIKRELCTRIFDMNMKLF